eukprot:comp21991_c0_seq1/m.31796 comp21991_c0_seq1/g.31796  ORF comp21991_c0_seq1/g.31796 comp21991_c0_seq1/m.31796 type:complete len:1283 (-) comp21991_c0_seq1:440-4288(-)
MGENQDTGKGKGGESDIGFAFDRTGNHADDPPSGSITTEEKGKAKKAPAPRANFKDLFRFADGRDYGLMGVGLIAAVLAGAAFPMFAVVFGDAMNAFYPYDQASINNTCLQFVYLAIFLGVSSYLQYASFAMSAARQVQQLRAACLKATLRQEIGWYDKSEASQVSSRIAGDTVIIQEGLGQKLGDVCKLLAQFLAGYVIGFIRGWKMTLVLLSAVPLLVVAMGTLAWALNNLTKKGQDMYAQAGAVVEEAVGGIRTTTALNAQQRMTRRYRDLCAIAEKVQVRGGVVMAASIGFMMMTMFLTYALGWWYGGKLVSNRDSQVNSVGEVVKVFFAVMVGSMAIAQMGPNAKAVADALGALSSALEILDRKSKIDVFDESGEIPKEVRGDIVLKQVEFTYPSRAEVQILKKLDLHIPAGKTVALVGASGSGKSTVISLLQRFYDIDKGEFLLDGHDIRRINLRWLRSKLGLVSQEPILFSGTIAENIAYGVTSAGREATREEIIAAAKKANAHKFIETFPDGYDTTVGEKGVQLSGGQKQRIAIARAIIREPSILLLDEATSALDTESERVVQEALDALLAEKNRTCIVVAHRLTTIRNADVIAVFKDGKIAEQGTHDELMEIEDGVYRNLVQLQLRTKDQVEAESAEDRKTSVASVRSLGAGARPSSSKGGSMLYAGGEADASQAEMAVDSTDAEIDRHVFWRLLALNKPRWLVCLVGISAAAAAGAIFPLWSIILTDMMYALGIYANNPGKLYDEICHYSVIFVIFALVVGAIVATRTFIYIYVGEKLTTELRNMTFEATLRQNIAYFDNEDNSTGAIAARLATEAKLVKSIAGESLGQMMQNMATLLSALLIAFILGSWKISLVLLAIMPLLVGVSTLQAKFLNIAAKKSQDHIVESGKRATEAISSIRTVAAFGLESALISKYEEALLYPRKEEIKKGNLGGMSVGGTQLLSFLAYALVFWYGGKLVGSGEITFDECMKSLMTIMFAAMGLAQTSSFMTDTSEAKNAGKKIYQVVDRQPIIDVTAQDGKRLDTVHGEIELKSVHFTYPSRPEQPILRGLDLKIKAGQTVAIVGESGCGKSTVISLVERFYDPDAGTVQLDGSDLRDLNVQWLRDQIGLVGQEPILFQGTIAQNIAMGKPGGASTSEVEEAAKMANAHNFIMTFPDAYNTEVGDRGVQLSGGQKQRIAIARAIVKNPAILLLDEATSALDAESERVVQAALDELLAGKKRTTIVIAHRLSTIKNADCIVVLRQGKVVEMGTHEQLMKLNGFYTNLHRSTAH